MENLPDDVNKIIYELIPSSVKKTLNKKLFICHYPMVMNYIIYSKNSHNYMTNLIRKNCYLHLEKILDVHYIKFLQIKRWKYKHSTYPNYLIFLKNEALKRNARRCYELVNKYLDPSKKNKYKRIRTKNIRWTN
jgi:hypothetical protein